jgi:hypothetical protein
MGSGPLQLEQEHQFISHAARRRSTALMVVLIELDDARTARAWSQ